MGWLRQLFSRRRRYDELSETIREHLDEKIADLMDRGMPREQAEQAARREFGNVTLIEERSREVWQWPGLDGVLADITFGLRQFRKAKTFAIASIMTLALGIGATTAIFTVVKAVLLSPLPYKDPDRIVAVWTTNASQGGGPQPTSPADFEIWRQRSQVFESLAPSYDRDMTLTEAGAPQFALGYAVSASYLRTLGVEPQLGRLFTDQEDKPGGPKVALLSNHLWRTTFQSAPDIIGRAITLNGNAYTVLGVMPSSFNYPTSVEVWTPTTLGSPAFDDFDHTYIRILGRLRRGVSIAEAQNVLNSLEATIAAQHPTTDKGNNVVVVPLRGQINGDIKRPLLLLFGAAGLVLLIACANTAGLALARNTERQKEIAVRLALGASRHRLLRQFLTENLILASIGGTIGIAIAFAGAHFLLHLFPNDVSNLNIPKVTHIPLDAGVLFFAIGTTLLSALFLGSNPVIRAIRTNAALAVKEEDRGNTASRLSNRSRNIMVISEIALALMLLSSAGLVVTSFRNAANVKLGFEPSNLLSLQVFLPPDRYPETESAKRTQFVESIVSRLRALPGVQSVAATNFLPLSGFWGTTNFLLPGQSPPKNGQLPEADNLVITPGYLHTMGIPLLQGRTFNTGDRAGGLHVAMVNQKFARDYLQGKNSIGISINLGSVTSPDWWQIIGVVGDVKSFGQDQSTHAAIYTPFAQQPFPLVAFVLRTGTDPAAVIHAAEESLWSVDPGLPIFKTAPVSELARQTLAIRRVSSVLISAFALLALLLACIGIYGVMAYSVTQRRKEIGVRMALGARRTDVLLMMMGMGARLTLIGIIIGLTASLACTRLLATLLFGLSALNPLIFGTTVTLLAAISITAAWFPARKAASSDPMEALRGE